MQLAATSRYAIRILFEIAQGGSPPSTSESSDGDASWGAEGGSGWDADGAAPPADAAPISVAAVADRTGISFRTVERITTTLRKNGFTRSVLGASGGIVLHTPLARISLGDIVTLFEGGVTLGVCCGDKSNDCPNQQSCGTRQVWHSISAKIQQDFNATSLEQLLFDGYSPGVPAQSGLTPLQARPGDRPPAAEK